MAGHSGRLGHADGERVEAAAAQDRQEPPLGASSRTIDIAERRARIGRRHRLHPALRATTVADVARDLTAVHSTDPASVYLAFRARLATVDPAAIERALYDERDVVRILGMRFRTPLERELRG